MDASSLAIEQKNLWRFVLKEKVSPDAMILNYLTGKLILKDLVEESENQQQKIIDEGITILISALTNTPIPRIIELLTSVPVEPSISASNIPQFSNFASAAMYLPTLLIDAQTPITYCEMGHALYSETKSDLAAEKYGQNHGNLAVQMDLAQLTKKGQKKAFEPTILTPKYCQLKQEEKIEVLQRLCFKIPIIQVASISKDPIAKIDECLGKALAESTRDRRRANVNEILAFALGK